AADVVRNTDTIDKLVRRVKEAVNIPVGLKGPPDPLFPDILAKAAFGAGADWVHPIMFAGAVPEVDIETGKPLLICADGETGTSGPMWKPFVLRGVNATARALDCTKHHITASGGIMSWRDAIEYFMYGCTTVQLCWVLSRKGYDAIGEIIDGLKQYCMRKDLKNITNIRGITQQYQVSLGTIMAFSEQTKGEIIAEVNMDKCSLCGTCVAPCFHGAIELKSHKLVIHKDRCDGCGLCLINCPRDAIKILNIDKFMDMYLKRELNNVQHFRSTK
ncbi:4Fe-4S binding protein, partial [Chloroflexota bacterium]